VIRFCLGQSLVEGLDKIRAFLAKADTNAEKSAGTSAQYRQDDVTTILTDVRLTDVRRDRLTSSEKMVETMNPHAISTILSFVANRPHGTTCPSEVARSLAHDDDSPLAWREYMPIVHDAVDALIARGEIILTWKSIGLTTRKGPYRISALNKAAR